MFSKFRSPQNTPTCGLYILELYFQAKLSNIDMLTLSVWFHIESVHQPQEIRDKNILSVLPNHKVSSDVSGMHTACTKNPQLGHCIDSILHAACWLVTYQTQNRILWRIIASRMTVPWLCSCPYKSLKRYGIDVHKHRGRGRVGVIHVDSGVSWAGI